MRILYAVHQFFPRHVGGTEVYTLALARAARAAGHKVAVTCYHESETGDQVDFVVEEIEFEEIPVFEIHYNLSVAPDPVRAEFDNQFVAERFREVLVNFKPDLVHFMHAMKISGATMEVCASMAVPFVVTVCDYWFVCPRHTLLRWDEKLCRGPREKSDCIKCVHATHGFFEHPWIALSESELRNQLSCRKREPSLAEQKLLSDCETLAGRNEYLRRQMLKAERIIALSPFAKQILCENSYPASRIEVVTHGVEFEAERRELPGNETPLHFVIVGSLVPFKGVHIVLEALAKIPETPLRLTVYGALSQDTPYIRSLLEQSKNDERIQFADTFPPREFPRILAQADVLLHPAQWYENAPIVIKAARKAGLSVLASDLGSIPAEVEVGENFSTLIPATDSNAWAEAIKRRTELGRQAAGARNPEIKDMGTNAVEVLEIYESLPIRNVAIESSISLSQSRAPYTHVADLLKHATIANELGGFVSVQQATINYCTKASIFQHPNSSICFPPMSSSSKVRLFFSIGIRQSSWEIMGDPVCFKITLLEGSCEQNSTERQVLFSRLLFPREAVEDRGWIDVEVDVPEDMKQSFQLEFSTTVAGGGNGSYCWAVWGDPRLQTEQLPVQKNPRKFNQGHVFLITADALRQDCLGCYGSTVVKTPNIDALGGDGTTFLDAYSVSSTTPGGYTSLFTGLYPPRHGVQAEWGRAPQDCMHLPSLFGQYGYPSVMIASEDELDDPNLGLSHYFTKCISSIGSPAQEGAMTTRSAIRAIKEAHRPTLFWVQYFDVHPPAIPPEPFSGMYYQGNPRSDENCYREELVQRIHGVESAVELDSKLPWLQAGIVDDSLVFRLSATVDALRGRGGSKPDLAIHLLALGHHTRLYLELGDFAQWLDMQVQQLQKGVITDELLSWLQMIREELRVVEADILSWLFGVRDFRYPVSQYYAGISYFDSQVGDLVRFLKENDLYEDSTIVVTAPHGEILDELGLCFHHHALRESVLRIPLVCKLPAKHILARGAAVGGSCEIVDLFPTLADALFSKDLPELPGRSLYSNMKNGKRVTERYRFALDAYGQMSSVGKGKFVLQRAERTHFLSKEWNWRAGETILIDCESDPSESHDCSTENAELVAELTSELSNWLERNRPLPLQPDQNFVSSVVNAIPVQQTLDVSFIIANYNRLDLLKECLNSVETTVSGLTFEILIVDDCSTDGSAEFIRALQAPVRGILNTERSGFAKNNNTAALQARGKYLCLLNNDLLLTPGWFEPLLHCFERKSKAGIVGNIQRHPKTECIDHIGVAFDRNGAPSNYGASVSRLPNSRYSEWPAVTAACCLIPRHLYFELGGFDEGYRNGFEDVDLCLRVRQAGYRVYVANRSVVYHHLHGSPGRFARELDNVDRFLRRWQAEGRLLSKLTPPDHYERLRNELHSTFLTPWSMHPLRFIRALKGYLRFKCKKALYHCYFSMPKLFPKRLQNRLGSA